MGLFRLPPFGLSAPLLDGSPRKREWEERREVGEHPASGNRTKDLLVRRLLIKPLRAAHGTGIVRREQYSQIRSVALEKTPRNSHKSRPNQMTVNDGSSLFDKRRMALEYFPRAEPLRCTNYALRLHNSMLAAAPLNQRPHSSGFYSNVTSPSDKNVSPTCSNEDACNARLPVKEGGGGILRQR